MCAPATSVSWRKDRRLGSDSVQRTVAQDKAPPRGECRRKFETPDRRLPSVSGSQRRSRRSRSRSARSRRPDTNIGTPNTSRAIADTRPVVLPVNHIPRTSAASRKENSAERPTTSWGTPSGSRVTSSVGPMPVSLRTDAIGWCAAGMPPVEHPMCHVYIRNIRSHETNLDRISGYKLATVLNHERVRVCRRRRARPNARRVGPAT